MSLEPPVIKVCGITNLLDAQLSVRFGANVLGFNFYSGSPRYIRAVDAQAIIDRVEVDVVHVGVCVAPENSREWDVLLSSLPPGIDVLQVHGVESAEALPRTDLPFLVATSLDRVDHFPDHQIIIDTSWGRGIVGDWKALQGLDRSYILSGGLGPANLAEALETLHPSGVDVCSGVETVPGKKNPLELERFLKIALHHYGGPDRSGRRERSP